MKRIFLFCFLALLNVAALAAVPKTLMWEVGYNLGYRSTPQAACAAKVSHLNTASPNVFRTVTGLVMETETRASCPLNICIPERPDLPCSSGAVTVYASQQCPENSSLVGKECICTPPATEQGGQCVPPEPSRCTADAGTSSVMNFTVGWARSGNPDADDHVGKVVFPNQGRGAACVGGCSWDFTDNGVAAYRSAEPFPASGLHRLSVDFTMRGAGTACAESPEDAAASPNAPEPPCPGFVGEVNGVTKCVGTASQPVPPPDGPTAGRQAGGSEDNGNPAAGKKPDSGEGSGSGGPGRTPTSGSGGNAGGPAGAAGGTRPDGTTTKPVEGKEQAACGAPGQPKCSINETGTPDGKGAYDAAKAGLDKAEGDYKAGLDAIKNTADKDTSWGVVPSWIAHAECRPWDLGAFEIMGQSFAIVISICDVMPYVVATTSFLWVVATFFLTIAMVFRVTAAPQG